MSRHRGLRNWWPLRLIETRNRPKRQVQLQLEELETRALLSAGSTAAPPAGSNDAVHPSLTVTPQKSSPEQSPSISGYTPQQIQQIYGFDQLGSVKGQAINGAGETIAIVDAYYDPNILSDASTFNSEFNLPQFNSSGGPTLNVISSTGAPVSSLSQDPTGDWDLETSLDVEWAHAMAPQANILLVETPDGNDSTMFAAAQYAAAQSGVVAVSMSWGDYEFSTETSYDSNFVPPKSNPGVTFVAASGDYGAASGPLYPATSPYVLAVGGTTLGGSTSPTSPTAPTGGLSTKSYLYRYASAHAGGLYNTSGSLSIRPEISPSTSPPTYPGETAWSGSGGGASAYEGEPSYQSNQASIDQTFGFPNVAVTNYYTGVTSYYYSRMTPDVAYNADPNSGYAVYDSVGSSDYGFSGGWTEVGGTSAGAPQWSAIVALADQERSLRGVGDGKPLDTNQVQNTLYNTLSNGQYPNVFHDITAGSNGYSAGVGYDLATGLGSPIVNNLVPLLANTTVPQGQLSTITGSGYGGASGSTSAGFGSTSFYSTSFYGFTAVNQPGGGLYAGSGSVTLPPGAASSNGQGSPIGGTPLASTPAPLLSASVMPLAAPLASSISTTDPIASGTAANASSVLASLSALPPTSPTGTVGATPLAGSTNAQPVQGGLLFGATGWNGAALSWRLGNLDTSGPKIEQAPAENGANSEDLGNYPSAGIIASDDGGDAEEDWSDFDTSGPALVGGDAGGDE